jgi:rhodanese-related sulfurtransferase
LKVYAKKSKKENYEILHESLLDFVNKTKPNWNYITPEELNKKDKSKFFILDIRDKEAYDEGHIKGSKNIFWMDLLKDENLKKLPDNKKILLVCYVGHTASQMLVALKLLGFDAMALKFGMGQSPVEGVPVAGWTDFGFEVVTSKK